MRVKSIKCCQLHRLVRLKISTRRYIWRQNWNICFSVAVFWICLRFRNIKGKYLRKMGSFILKYTAKHWTYSRLQYWKRYFFRIDFALKLVYFSDLLGFEYAYLCLEMKLNLLKLFWMYTYLSKSYKPYSTGKLIYFWKQDDWIIH